MTTTTAERTLSFVRAEHEALWQEMARDPRVILIGEDVAGGAGRAEQGKNDAWGGPFGVSKGLIGMFGEQRVLDTPICENTFMGAAVGAALAGLRPVADLMFINFMSVALDAIMNQAGPTRYMLGGQANVPVVFKTAIGAVANEAVDGGGTAAQHSGSMYSMLAHIPGIKVVVPSDAYTAKGLLAAAIRDDDPVVYCSHRRLMATQAVVPEEPYTLPIGKARIVRPGRHLTLVGIARTVHLCLDAAEALAQQGIDAEVIDLLSLSPLDEETVVESVTRTKRLIVVDEDTPLCSVASHVAAVVADQAFDYLDCPPKTVNSAHAPVPFSARLEAAYLPSVPKILAAVQAMGIRL